ncbi:MAG: ribonuclease H-like domain-containing protein [Desulforhopalus sp.]
MLEHTFCHIPGIGPKTERKLWAAGITTWNGWNSRLPVRLSAATLAEAQNILEASSRALESDPKFFTTKLGSTEPWRILPHYRSKTAYLDIETTGLDDFADITTIALYDGREIYTYVNGQNLEDFPRDIFNYQVLVSYNGKTFDIPVLEKYFKIRLDQAHIDLRYVLARLGYKGGLKGCEKSLGLHRGGLEGVDGYFAVQLWRLFKQENDQRALETLLAYNIEDTVNLERLAVEAYNRNIAATPFADDLLLPNPVPPAIPHNADYTVIEKIRRDLYR